MNEKIKTDNIVTEEQTLITSAMWIYNAGAFIAATLFLQSVVDATTFDPLKAFLSPVSRVTRTRKGTFRAQGTEDPLTVLDFVGLVSLHNYTAEEYVVTTTDGYNLVLHRIPSSPLSFPKKKKPVVFVQHGFIASSDTWVLRGPGKDLAFILADDGYDVWLGNFRGNTYSRSHISLSPEDPEFWKFSYHEMGFYDLPAMLDYVLENTGQKSLIYIGHSMGTTASYVLLSMRPEYNKRLSLVVSLAPIAFWYPKLSGLVQLMTLNGILIETTFRNKGIVELLPQSSFYIRLASALCNDHAVTQKSCIAVFGSFAGYDSTQLNASFIQYLAGYFPAGASVQTLSHYRQCAVTRKFALYDFGIEENLRRYKQARPPDYDLSKITAPSALIYGKNDLLAQVENVMVLAKKLPNIVIAASVPYVLFSHLDFLWAEDSKSLIYDDVKDLIGRFS